MVPDLEEMCREYLARRQMGAHEQADFVVLEMIDQCVRQVGGGEMGGVLTGAIALIPCAMLT